MTAAALRKAALVVATFVVFAFVFAPIVSTIVLSFNADRFATLSWGGFSLTWYEAVFNDATIRRSLWNSLEVALATCLIATFLGFAAAYVDYRYRFFGKAFYLALAVLPPTVPVVILGVALLTFEGRIGLSGSLAGVIVGHVTLAAPFAMALVRMRLANLDPDVERAAWNLGATPWATMGGVILPFCLPAILAALFLTAAVSFDEYMIAWFVSGSNETLPVRVLALLQGQVSPRINAVGAIVFTVSMTLVLVAQAIMGRRLAASAHKE